MALPGRLNETHPALAEGDGGFGSPSEANGGAPLYSADMWKEIDEEKDRLFDLMYKVQQKLVKDQTGQDAIDLRTCNWAQVMAQVQMTGTRWKSRPSKQGKTMVFIDKVGQNSSALQSWLGLLPAGDYGSSICGVFTLAIGAAGHYGKVEEAAFEALSDIPIIMESARKYLGIYRKMQDQDLEKRTFELFRAILSTLRHVMQFFADGKSRRVFEGVLKQDGYKAELFQSLEEVKKRAQAVKDEALQCQAQMISMMSDSAEENARLTNERLNEIYEFLRQGKFADATISDIPSSPNLPSSPPRLKGTSYNSTSSSYVTSSLHKHGITDHHQYDAEAGTKRLLEYTKYDPGTITHDVAMLRRLGYRADQDAKARAAVMIGHDHFRWFIQESQLSTCLLVNGREDLSMSTDISPTSLVVSELAGKLDETGSRRNPVFTLKYFCASHPPSAYTNHPSQSSPCSGMLASLLGQLLQQLAERGVSADLSFLSKNKWRKIEELDVETLCSTFKKVARQTPPGTAILCMIDEISLYETKRLQHGTSHVMEKLVQLARPRKDDEHRVFKLLLTCQTRALGVSRLFTGCVIDLPEETEPDDKAEWVISTM
ncbi:hypothetical protein N3K66_000170 [Trichothecium roseum]|uniref:Uncharacterized protein n=1 Tax=Trichothecium roseum TaxID=47278 RepID=A0ACC0VB18_9HYPO|nr:hypothetical protein N3K66_000170 [Trichothecium roseum]